MLRLFLFYVISIGLMLAMVPWSQAGATQSPFVTAFSLIGVPYAADIMNFVVLTAALSAINSMMYVTSRMMFSLSRGGYAPKAFGNLTKNGVPLNALIISCAGVLLAIVVNRIIPQDSQFVSMMGMSMFGPVFTWMMILITHLYFRPKWKAMGGRELPVRMPFFPVANWIGIILLGGVVLYSCLTVFKTTLAMGIPWFILISLVYFIWFKKKENQEQ
jgi:L-asparagine transporter-like permease